MPSLQQTTVVTATTSHEIKLSPRLKRRLLTELKTYHALKSQRDALDSAMKKHRGNVEEVLSEAGESSIGVDGYKATLVAPIRRKLDPKKLVSLGVSTDIIDRATVESSGTPYVKVTCPGEKDHEED